MNTNQVYNYGYNDNNLGTMNFDGTTMADNLLPFNQSLYCEANNSMKAESGLTYNLPSVPRKRSRDSMNELHRVIVPQKQPRLQDFQHNLPIQMQQQRLEIDQIIAQHVSRSTNILVYHTFFFLRDFLLIKRTHTNLARKIFC